MSPSLFKSDPQGGPSTDQPDGPAPPSARERGEKPRRRSRADTGVISVFGAGLVVEGEVKSRGDITIEGRLKGDISVEGQVSVAAQGVVEGELTAQRVVVAGRVTGTIQATESTRLIAGAKVDADVSSPRLELEDGATLNGRISMGKESSSSATSPGATSPSAKSDRATNDKKPEDSGSKSSKRDVA